jgi:hypothetical protein
LSVCRPCLESVPLVNFEKKSPLETDSGIFMRLRSRVGMTGGLLKLEADCGDVRT